MDYSREAYEALKIYTEPTKDEWGYSWIKCNSCGQEVFGPEWWVKQRIVDGQCKECREGA